MNFTSKLIGILRMILSLVWMGLAISGIIYGLKGIDWLEVNLRETITTASHNIKVVNTILVDVTDVIDYVEEAFDTVELALIDAGLILEETRPTIDETNIILTQDVPQALDDVQDAMPSIIEAAATVDQTLGFLSRFKFTIPNPLGADFEIDLGVDYDPSVPFEDAVISLSTSLEGIPEEMRELEDDLLSIDFNMAVISDDLLDIAYDFDQMREEILDINPELENIIASLDEVHVDLKSAQQDLPGIANTTEKVLVAFMELVILTQIPSMYAGYLMTKSIAKNGKEDEVYSDDYFESEVEEDEL